MIGMHMEEVWLPICDQIGDRKSNLEFKVIETVCVEVIIDNTKWFIAGLYRQPCTKDSDCYNDLFQIIDQSSVLYDNVAFIGDMNYIYLIDEK
jgi:hypothetical protein